MSYDYFLWRTKRPVTAQEINETTVETWSDPDAVREVISEMFPTLVWRPDNKVANDCSGATSIGGVRLPDVARNHDPLVIKTSHRVRSDEDLLALGKKLRCLVFDAQSGEILYQPAPSAPK